MKNQKGFALFPILAIIVAGALLSGYATLSKDGVQLHKEVIKQGQAVYKTNQ